MISYETSFGRGQWSENLWQTVRSPRWNVTSRWIQNNDHIVNDMPDDIRPEDMQMGRDRTGETYVSMLYRVPQSGSRVFSMTCSFDGRMAPLMVFAPELTDVYRAHWELVLYDRGVNLWRYDVRDGRLCWRLEAFLDMPLAPGEKHTVEARIEVRKNKGSFLFIRCAGQCTGTRLDDFPETYYAGITACEGRNRFYDFSIKAAELTDPVLLERFTD